MLRKLIDITEGTDLLSVNSIADSLITNIYKLQESKDSLLSTSGKIQGAHPIICKHQVIPKNWYHYI